MNPLHLPLALPPAYAAAGMGGEEGGMAGHASRESRIRRGKGRGCPQEGHEGAVERGEGEDG